MFIFIYTHNRQSIANDLIQANQYFGFYWALYRQSLNVFAIFLNTKIKTLMLQILDLISRIWHLSSKIQLNLLYSQNISYLNPRKNIIMFVYKKQIKKAKAQRKNQSPYNYEYQYDSRRNKETREEKQLRQLRQLQSASQQNNQDQSNYIDKKALRWWQRIEEKYFKQIDKSDIFIFRDLIFRKFQSEQGIDDSQENFKYEKMSIYSYSHESIENASAYHMSFLESQIQCYNSFIRVPSIIRVLFQNNDATDKNIDSLSKQNSDHKNQILAFFELENKPESVKSESIEAMIPQQQNEAIEQVSCQFKTKYIGTRNNKVIIEENFKQLNNEWRLNLIEYQDNFEFLEKCKRYKMENEKPYIYEIDKEIALWEWGLENQYHQNTIRMNQLQSNIQETQGNKKNNYSISSKQAIQKQVEQINYALTWSTILRCFEEGHKDKTWELFYSYRENQAQSLRLPANKARMRAVAKNRLQNNITSKERQREKYKFLETDCKICFCSVNPDSNQVLYCDECNTSFHRACYGLNCIPPQQNYYCDTCKYKRKEKNSRNTSSYFAVEDKKEQIRIYCQICQKQNFPMKNIDSHFYHITCLILCNFIQFKNGKFLLVDGLTHKQLQTIIADNEINHGPCQFCIDKRNCDIGMQFVCSFPNCSISYHPICAYLGGCEFQIKKHKVKGKYQLKVSIYCNNHNQQRKHLQQVYLRQYMCNLNCLSGKDQKQFYEILKREQEKKVKAKQRNSQMQIESLRILGMTGRVGKYRNERQQAQKKNKFGDIKTETSDLLAQLKKKPKKF